MIKNNTHVLITATFIAAFVCLLSSCGTKKPAAATTHTEEAQEKQVIQEELIAQRDTMPVDTLPDFLKEFAEDSTIHINWAYGIPFIIDDSVPMLLPPIDKNLEGYVSRTDYKKHIWNPGRVLYYWGEVLPTDTIFWLNKVLCDLEAFSLSLERGFEYIYYIYYVKSEAQHHTLIEIELLAIRTPECKQDGTTKHYKYYFRPNGDLIGKCNKKIKNADVDAFYAIGEEKRIILSYIRHTDDFETWLNAH